MKRINQIRRKLKAARAANDIVHASILEAALVTELIQESIDIDRLAQVRQKRGRRVSP